MVSLGGFVFNRWSMQVKSGHPLYGLLFLWFRRNFEIEESRYIAFLNLRIDIKIELLNFVNFNMTFLIYHLYLHYCHTTLDET